MKLQELAGIKKYNTGTIGDFLNRGIESGTIKVRSGSFAFVVIPKDLDYVYKVWTHDPAWEEYLSYLQNHPGNPHLLRVISRTRTIPFTFKRPANFNTDMKIVKLEKLQQLSSVTANDIMALEEVIGGMNISKLDHTDAPEIMRLAGVGPTSFIETVIDVLKHCGNFHSDFHSENVMERADGTLVITDPYFEPHDGKNITITAADLLHGKYYGQYK